MQDRFEVGLLHTVEGVLSLGVRVEPIARGVVSHVALYLAIHLVVLKVLHRARTDRRLLHIDSAVLE